MISVPNFYVPYSIQMGMILIIQTTLNNIIPDITCLLYHFTTDVLVCPEKKRHFNSVLL